MPKVVFTAPFAFSPDGHTVIEYPPGDADVSDRCAEVAAQAGVLEEPEPQKEPEAQKEPTAPWLMP